MNSEAPDGRKMTGIVLAAGSSSRMGRTKQLLPAGDKSLLERVVSACLAASLEEVILVLGHEADRIRASLGPLREDPRLTIVENPRHAEGMSTSLVEGLRRAEASSDRIMVVLGDMPGVTPSLLDRLRLEVEASGCTLGAVAVGGRRTHPVVIGREHFETLRGLTGDRGARGLFRSNVEGLCLVEAGETYEGLDIDTPEDYRRFREGRKGRP